MATKRTAKKKTPKKKNPVKRIKKGIPASNSAVAAELQDYADAIAAIADDFDELQSRVEDLAEDMKNTAGDYSKFSATMKQAIEEFVTG